MKTYCIQVTDYEGNQRSVKVVNPSLVRVMLPDFIEAVDVKAVDVIDGLTGEVIFSWNNGKLTWLAL